MITVKRKAKFAKATQRRQSAEEPVGRVPRAARLMALAIRFDQLIRDGVVADQAELARLGQVSRARVSQSMDLLQLAPDIHVLLLFFPESQRGRQRVTERATRSSIDIAAWKRQRCAMESLMSL